MIKAIFPVRIASEECVKCYFGDRDRKLRREEVSQMSYKPGRQGVDPSLSEVGRKEARLSKAERPMNEFPLMEPTQDSIVLFHPHIPEKAIEAVGAVLRTRWIGQGPRVEEFEQKFTKRFAGNLPTVAVGSGTDALHLAYILAGLQPGDEVISSLFTCTATNIPFLYMGVDVVFADVQPGTLNIDPDDVRRRITRKTKAISCVHYGGLPCDMDELQTIANEHGLNIIEDAAHALGATYKGRTIGSISDFTVFSFQAIKNITTGDGGMLVLKDEALIDKAQRLRWFGIDRKAKQDGTWQNDLLEVGYKYQMTDIAAALGLAALDEFEDTLAYRRSLLREYERELPNIPGLTVIGANYEDRTHAAWMCTVLAEEREALQRKLREQGIESGQVHYRNDRYTIFGGRLYDYPNMDAIEDKYLVLPLHTHMSVSDVRRICSIIRGGW
jgi:dTDP-4-amino-4,6-dideoxygalactose transaminase